MSTSVPNEKEIFDGILRLEALRRLRATLDDFLGRPVWWISYKTATKHSQIQQVMEWSGRTWNDPRTRNFSLAKKTFSALAKKHFQAQPYFYEKKGERAGYCVPILLGEKVIGCLVLSGLKKNVAPAALQLLTDYLQLLTDHYSKTEELNRLSATIRPRAIALSTVHTVHRIINSTLNLDELVSRLAHLTAQVLRVNRCAIYLVDKNSAFPVEAGRSKRRASLLCKALVGYPKNREKGERILFGRRTEGRVAKTADIRLRKKYICIPLIDEDVIGVVMVSRKKDKKEFNYFDLEILTTLAEEAVIAIKNAQLYEEQRKVILGTIQSLAIILGTRLPTHSIISSEISVKLALRVAEDLKLSEEESQALHYATLLKETTKIGIPEAILHKSSKLTGAEFDLLRSHPIEGARIVQSFESLKSVAPIILYSREKYDGTGYPEGLKGERIPIGARILSVINAFEAIIVGRPYRDQSSQMDALEEISRNSGTQFDPRVVESFVRVVKKEGFPRLSRVSAPAPNKK